MSGRNVVPMPKPAPAPASAPFPSQLPFPWPNMWGGGGAMPAGCCPPGGMDALMQCYCDIQAATAFISKVVTDLAANDPAFQQALVDAIAASGSNIPLIGVTNGADAQPGQVGEAVEFNVVAPIPVTAAFNQSITMGVLQPGDWMVWAACQQSVLTTGMYLILNPSPPGFSNPLVQEMAGPSMGQATVLVPAAARALISVPTLINFSLTSNTGGAGTTAGNASVFFLARRMR